MSHLHASRLSDTVARCQRYRADRKVAAVVAVEETLLTHSASARHQMEGLIFEYATWLRPGNAEGFVEQQSAACDDCPAGTKAGVGCGANDTYVITPGNVAVLGSKDVAFHNCVRPTLLQAPY